MRPGELNVWGLPVKDSSADQQALRYTPGAEESNLAEGVPSAGSSPKTGPSRQKSLAPTESAAVSGGVTGERLLELLSTVIAPTTLVTALLFYFGWMRTNTLFQYFGIEATMLRFSPSDYVLRSVDTTFIPMSAVIFLALGALGLHRIVKSVLSTNSTSRGCKYFIIIMAVLGIAAIVRGLVGAAIPSISNRDFLITPTCLGLGTLIAVYAMWLLSRTQPANKRIGMRAEVWAVSAPLRVLTGLVLVMSLFWGTAEYAQAVGRGLASSIVHHLDNQPEVVVYSKEPLLLQPPVKLDQLPGPSGSYRYRYNGLRLLIESAGRVILLPDHWSRNKGPAIVLEESGLRLELYPGSGYWK